MPQLYLHNKSIETIFELLGQDENAITYSVGWGLHSSRSFLREFLRETIGYEGSHSGATVRLQDYRETQGITDIEIKKPSEFYVVVEAKKGWALPGARQLKKYALRLGGRGYRTRKILVLSEYSAKHAEDQLECRNVNGICVQAISWKAVARAVDRAISRGNYGEKRLLRELLSYLGRVTTMRSIEPNEVYVVSLQGRGIENVRRRRYCHPVGVHGWPKEPPDYIAFRYHGKLQSIHHVSSFEWTVGDPLSEFPSKDRTPHFLYKLGPAIVPPKEVRTGDIFRNGRVRCFWDTLLTCKTISEARDLSEKRRKMVERMGE